MNLFDKKPKDEVQPQRLAYEDTVPSTSIQVDSTKMQEIEDAIIKMNEKFEKQIRNTNEYISGVAKTVTKVAEKVSEVENQNVAGVTRLTDEQRISNIEQTLIKIGNTMDAVASNLEALIEDYIAFKPIVKIKKEKSDTTKVASTPKKRKPKPELIEEKVEESEPDDFEDVFDEDEDNLME